jgi:hypothetical protein
MGSKKRRRERRTFVTVGFTRAEIARLREYMSGCSPHTIEDVIGDLAMKALPLEGVRVPPACADKPAQTKKRRPPCASSYCDWPQPCNGCNARVSSVDVDDMCVGEQFANGYR